MIGYMMTLGPAAVAIETSLDLHAAVEEVRIHGGSLPFRLERFKGPIPGQGMPAVVHTGQAQGEPRADYLARQWLLRLYASEDELSGVDLLFLSYLLLEWQLHRNGLITLHAAAVERDGSALLLLGHSGAGKTTTAIRLCRDYGCRLIGNDLVVVGGPGDPQALCGTTHVRLRHSSVSRTMPDLLQLFPVDVPDPWRTKVDIPPHRLGIGTTSHPTMISAVIFVHVDSDYPALVVADGDTLIHRLNLYENALRHIRATSTPWLIGNAHGFGPFVPSLDDAAAHAARTAALNRLLQRAHYVAGPALDVAAHGARLLGIDTAALTAGRGSQ